MDKLYYYLKDINEEKLFKTLSKLVEKDKNYKNLTEKQKMQYVFDIAFNNENAGYVVCLSKQEALSDDITSKIDEKVSILNKLGCKNKNIVVSVLDDSHKFSNEEWHKIERLNNYLTRHNEKNKHKNIKFGFDNQGKTWNSEKVKSANDQLNNTANEIRAKHLSPLEQLIECYKVVTDRYYTEEAINQHESESRSVYGLLNSVYIVCAGYSDWICSLNKLIGNDNVKIYKNGIQIAETLNDDYLEGRHENTIVYIKDDKYNFEGYYYMDPTWDFNDGETVNLYSNFLIPLTDIKYYYSPIRQDEPFLMLKRYEEQLNTSNYALPKKIENEMAKLDRFFQSYLNKEDTYKYAMEDSITKNFISFSKDDLVYNKPFINDVFKSNVFKNTVKDIVPYVLNKKLDNDIAYLENLSIIKKDIYNNYANINKKYNSKLCFINTKKTIKDLDRILNSITYKSNFTSKYIIGDNITELPFEPETSISFNKDAKKERTQTIAGQLIKEIKEQEKNIHNEIEYLTNLEKNLKDNKFNAKYIIEHKENILEPKDKTFFTSLILDETLKYISTPIPFNKLKAALLTCFKDEKVVEDLIKTNIDFQKRAMNYEDAQNAISTEIVKRIQQEKQSKQEKEKI